jgi:hypothetical protein
MRTSGAGHIAGASGAANALAVPATQATENPYAVRFVSVLLGITAAMALCGLTIRLRGAFAETGLPVDFVGRTVIGTALLSLALGVRVPQQIAWWVCVQARRRVFGVGRSSGVSSLLLTPAPGDKPLYWVVLSIVALCAGAATALMPLMTGAALSLREWMLAEFLWSPTSLAILQTVLTLTIVVVPVSITGLAFSGMHHLTCPQERWDIRACTWLLIGAGIGAVSASRIAAAVPEGNVVMVAAALPALVVALVAAVSKVEQEPSERLTVPGSTLPIWTDRWSVLVRVGVVLIGGGCAYATAFWLRQPDAVGRAAQAFPVVLLAALGLGVAAGCQLRRKALRSIGGFGMACVAAGAVLTGVSGFFHVQQTISSSSALILAFFSLFGLGFATAYGQQALLNRVANRSVEGAKTLAHTLVCASILMWFGEPVANHLAGRLLSFAFLAICLLGLGGVLIVYEPDYTLRSRRIRLFAVFACLGTMLAILAPPGASAMK